MYITRWGSTVVLDVYLASPSIALRSFERVIRSRWLYICNYIYLCMYIYTNTYMYTFREHVLGFALDFVAQFRECDSQSLADGVVATAQGAEHLRSKTSKLSSD